MAMGLGAIPRLPGRQQGSRQAWRRSELWAITSNLGSAFPRAGRLMGKHWEQDVGLTWHL